MSIPSFDPTRPALPYTSRIPMDNRPWTNIVPFTVRDNATMILILREMRIYLNETLVPSVNENMAAVIASWNATVDKLIDEVLNSSIQLQDPIMAALVVDPESETHAALSTLLANIITPDLAAGREGYFIITAPTPAS